MKFIYKIALFATATIQRNNQTKPTNLPIHSTITTTQQTSHLPKKNLVDTTKQQQNSSHTHHHTTSHTKPTTWSYQLSLPVDDTITLRTVELKDSKALFDLGCQNRENIHPHLPTWLNRRPDLQTSLAIVKRRQDTWQDFHQHFVVEKRNWYIPKGEYIIELGIWQKQQDTQEEKLIGWLSAHRLESNPNRVMFGYWLANNHSGKNIMTKSCLALTDYLFATIPDLAEVNIITGTDNKASQRVAEKLHFACKKTYKGNLFATTRQAWEQQQPLPKSSTIFKRKLLPSDASTLYDFVQQHKNKGSDLPAQLAKSDSLANTYSLINQRMQIAHILQQHLPELVWPRAQETIFDQWILYTYDSSSQITPQIIGWVGCSHRREGETVRLRYWFPNQEKLVASLWMTFPEIIQDFFDTYPPLPIVEIMTETQEQETLAKKIGLRHSRKCHYMHFNMPRHLWQEISPQLKKKYHTHQ